MLESDLWKKLRTGMGSRWRAHRIENRIDEGTPDVFFTIAVPGTATRVAGMVELKSFELPKSRKITLRHFTQDQRDFIKLHHTLLLLYSNGHYMLFGPTTGHLVGRGQSFEDHKAVALWSSDCPNWDQFATVVTDQLRA